MLAHLGRLHAQGEHLPRRDAAEARFHVVRQLAHRLAGHRSARGHAREQARLRLALRLGLDRHALERIGKVLPAQAHPVELLGVF
jgi:hypothetical protein